MLCALALSSVALAAPVSIESLLAEMIDMERLATPIDPDVTCDQFSSYDRASVSADQDGWFANGDAGQFLRQEQNEGRDEWVMADMEGPGHPPHVVGQPRWRGYDPRLHRWEREARTGGELPRSDHGRRRGLPAPFLRPASDGGRTSTSPSPTPVACKVTVSRPNLYYTICGPTQGTEVQPFSMGQVMAAQDLVAEVGAVLANPNQPLSPRFTQPLSPITVDLPAGGGIASLPEFLGPAAISRLEVKVVSPKWEHRGPATQERVGGSPDLIEALRGTVLTMRWDDEARPAVWTPLGDFFGTAPGMNPFYTLPTGMTEDGVFYSNWFMPFRSKAQVTLRNDSTAPLKLTITPYVTPLKWPRGGYLYFRAGWKTEWFPAEPAFVDWLMLDADGPGRYVGTMLGIMNTIPAWWGEGDEKVWVDDDTFPSFFGTARRTSTRLRLRSLELFTPRVPRSAERDGPGQLRLYPVNRFQVFEDIRSTIAYGSTSRSGRQVRASTTPPARTRRRARATAMRRCPTGTAW